MNAADLQAVVDALGSPRVLVIGDLILDRYVLGDVTRISPEAPIPVLTARTQDVRLGGAGNVAANLRAMDAGADVVGILGGEGRGRQLLELLAQIGAESDGCVVDPERPTTEKTRMMSGVQQMLRVDWEESQPISAELCARLAEALTERLGRAQAVVLSDYGKGFLAADLIRDVVARARDAGVPVLVDPKGSDYSRYRGATLITPNRKEAEEALGRGIGSLDELPAAAEELMDVAALDAVVITLGADGMYFRTRDGRSGRVPTVARAVFDVTGAGDTVISQLAVALAAGVELEAAVHLANNAAGIVVARRGTAAITRSELRAALGAHEGARAGKVLAPEELDRAVAEWRSQGLRIAFTNGCYDLLHAGHVDLLRFAASKADVLLVGVNDDESVRRLKGPERPVNPLADRLEVLAALECVAAVVPFPEDTPGRLIEQVTPHVLVKGEDYADKVVVGREWVESHGGQVHLAPLRPGRSTSAILARARERQPGAGPL